MERGLDRWQVQSQETATAVMPYTDEGLKCISGRYNNLCSKVWILQPQGNVYWREVVLASMIRQENKLNSGTLESEGWWGQA